MLLLQSFDWKSAGEHDGVVIKCIIVYLVRDIPLFVMYCVYGESGSPLPIATRPKKHFKNEQRSRVAAATLKANTSGVQKINNYCEDIYIPPSN